MATIYRVTENDNQIRFYWFVTKKEALQHVREYEPPFEGATCEIEPQQVETTRFGLVNELNHVISLTCFNEG